MLGYRLKTLRILNNYTQQNMADKLNIALRNYQKYESDETKPSLDNLVKLADCLNVTTDYLLGRVESHEASVDEH